MLLLHHCDQERTPITLNLSKISTLQYVSSPSSPHPESSRHQILIPIFTTFWKLSLHRKAYIYSPQPQPICNTSLNLSTSHPEAYPHQLETYSCHILSTSSNPSSHLQIYHDILKPIITSSNLPWHPQTHHHILKSTMTSSNSSSHPQIYHDILKPIITSSNLPWHPQTHHHILKSTMTSSNPSSHPQIYHDILKPIITSSSPSSHPQIYHDILKPIITSSNLP